MAEQQPPSSEDERGRGDHSPCRLDETPTTPAEYVDILRREILQCLRLQPVELRLASPSSERCDAMRRMGELYTRNLIPPAAFFHLYQWKTKRHRGENGNDDELAFRRLIRQGGMIESWVQSTWEHAYQLLSNPNHISVRDTTFGALRNQHPGQGTYRALGLETDAHELAASLTFREPPQAPTPRRKAYAAFIGKQLQKQPEIDPLQYPTMMEIDTINVHPDHRGAGSALIAWAIANVALRPDPPKDIYYYRFSRIAIARPRLKGRRGTVPENTVSSALFTDCGFDDLRERSGKYIVREVEGFPEGLVTLRPTWRYGIANFQVALALSFERWRRVAKSK
jgi:hypothetical protein